MEPPLELSLFHDSENRPLVVGRPGPDVPDATDESSRVENGRSLRNSLRSDHFFLEAMGVQNVVRTEVGSEAPKLSRAGRSQTSATGGISNSLSTLLPTEA